MTYIFTGSVESAVLHGDTGAFDNSQDRAIHVQVTETVSSGNDSEKHYDDKVNSTFRIENMSVGESIILQIDDNGMVVTETPAYRKVTDVKIHPAVSVLSTDSSGLSTEQSGIRGIQRSDDKPPACVQVRPVLGSKLGSRNGETETQAEKTGGQREIETQTEYTEDDLDDKEQRSVEESSNEPKVIIK